MKSAAIILALIILSCSSAAHAQGPPPLRVDTSLYPFLDRLDNDTDLTITINARLPQRFSYFSYLNFRGTLHSEDFEFARSEQNLRWAIGDKLPLDLNLQAVIVQGSGNDFGQLGLGWRVHDTPALANFFDRINLIYRLTFQLKRFGSDDDSAWQMEHFFKLQFPGVSERLYVSGFIDQTFDLDLPEQFPSSPVVAEIQGGVRVWKNFYVVAEYRVNQFREGNEYNLAAGIEFQYALR